MFNSMTKNLLHSRRASQLEGWESMRFSLLQYRGKQQESNGSISVSDVHPQ